MLPNQLRTWTAPGVCITPTLGWSGAEGDGLAWRPDGRHGLVQLGAADPARAAVLDRPHGRVLIQEAVTLDGVQQDVVAPAHAGVFVARQQPEANQRNHQPAAADLRGISSTVHW